MRIALYTLLLLLFQLPAYGQDGMVTIEEDPNITKLLEIYKNMNTDTGYFTIQIGFGSYAEATKLKSDASVDFPQYGSRIIFDSPTYRVHLGRFKSKLEVERFYNEVRKKYPQSIILKPLGSSR
jgi:hypothetical protein